MTVDEGLGNVLEWEAARDPDRVAMEGETVRLVPLDQAAHARELFTGSHGPGISTDLWLYMSVGPFDTQEAFTSWLETCAQSTDPLFFTVIDSHTGRSSGMVSYLRITPGQGVIEIGNIWFSPTLQRTRQATEAIYLLARHVFDDCGYRRLEWKCNALNEPSRRAAERFGFRYEGLFRQHMVIKGRNRDTTWYAMIDRDWPVIRAAFERWLAPENFDEAGRQRQTLAAIRATIEVAPERG
jgi:RimJ/RimL family protein N-acetyltransferase